MKLNEILKENLAPLSAGKAQKWLWDFCNSYRNQTDKFQIHDNGTVEVSNQSVMIDEAKDGRQPTFPFPKFGTLQGQFGDLYCNGYLAGYNDLSWLPDSCNKLTLNRNQLSSIDIKTRCDKLELMNNNLKTLEGLPQEGIYPGGLSEIDLRGNPIKSLVGVNDHIKSMSGTGYFLMDFTKVKKGGIGLIMIPGLRSIGIVGSGASNRKAWGIIDRYLGKPDKIFECQEELIEAGFEEYAQL